MRKRCQKCQHTQDVAEFTRGLSFEELIATRARGGRFCHTCRTTFQRCTNCERDLPITEFSTHNGARYGRCKACHSAIRRRGYAHMAAWIAERERAAGRDPADDRGFRHYSRDPDDVLRDGGRRRRARLRATQRQPYSRHAVFERDGWRCWCCSTELDENTATVDHLIPVAAGGPDTFDNVRAACRPCNSRRGANVADASLAGSTAFPVEPIDPGPRAIGRMKIITLPLRGSRRRRAGSPPSNSRISA